MENQESVACARHCANPLQASALCNPQNSLRVKEILPTKPSVWNTETVAQQKA